MPASASASAASSAHASSANMGRSHTRFGAHSARPAIAAALRPMARLELRGARACPSARSSASPFRAGCRRGSRGTAAGRRPSSRTSARSTTSAGVARDHAFIASSPSRRPARAGPGRPPASRPRGTGRCRGCALHLLEPERHGGHQLGRALHVPDERVASRRAYVSSCVGAQFTIVKQAARSFTKRPSGFLHARCRTGRCRCAASAPRAATPR